MGTMTRIPRNAEVTTIDGRGRIQEYTLDGYRVIFNRATYHGEIPPKFTDKSPTISKEYTLEEVERC